MGTPYEERRKKGHGGAAEVRKLKDSIKVVFKQKDGTLLTYEFSEDDCLCDLHVGDVFAQLTKDNTQIQAIRPLHGSFVMKLNDFGHRQGQPPTFRTERARTVYYKDKDTGEDRSFPVDARLAFSALLEIVDDKEWMGTIVPFTVPYTVDQDRITGVAMIAGEPSNAKAMRYFMEMFGFDFEEDAIPYSPNILPMLLSVLHEADAYVQVKVENGYIPRDGLSYAPSGYIAQIRKKSAAKKSPAKKATTKKATATKKKTTKRT